MFTRIKILLSSEISGILSVRTCKLMRYVCMDRADEDITLTDMNTVHSVSNTIEPLSI